MLLPGALPGSLGLTEGATGLFTPAGVAYNYAVGGLPFLSAATNDDPLIRETAPVRKEQTDDQALPGEQTFDYWWLRSQQSFHGGAGQVFADPTEDNPFNSIRFRTSRNVNPWVQGEISLLNEATPTAAGAITSVLDATEFSYGDGDAAAFAITATDIVVLRAATRVAATFPETAGALQSATTDGTSIFVVALDGVWSAPIPAAYDADIGTEFVFTQQYDMTNTDPCFIAFVKSRLVLGVGPAVYELEPAPGTPPAALPTALYTHPDASWVWTGITESGSAIYVVGNANGVRGSILKFVLDDTGEIPTLTAATIAAQLPSGEVPHSAMGYLGRFVAIGTNRGVRVGIADTNGDIEYGPILFETDSPVLAWSARDRFLWCTVSAGIDGDSGLYRIDLGLELAPLRFPYATDLVADGDQAVCGVVAHLGSSDRICFATATDVYVQQDDLAPTGYLQTSRIRYNTVEPKLYRYVRVRGPVLGGPLTLQMIDQADNVAGSQLFPSGKSPGGSDVAILQPRGPIDFMSLRFNLSRDSSDAEAGPMVWAYQLKALPGSSRQRLIQLPLWCFDWEADRHGQRIGSQGGAYRRLTALEDLESSGDTVVLQDFDVNQNTECVLERITFRQMAPPPRFEGWGGVLTVTLRTLS